MNKSYRDILDSAASPHIPDDLNLFPRVAAQLNQRKTFMQTLRARPALAILLAFLALLLLTGVAYAIGRLTGYIPGIGFVQKDSLRVLAEPVSQTQDGITVSIEQVFADSERTIIIYKTEGLTIAAANSNGEGGGNPFGSVQLLRLPDGSTLEESTGYSGTPEPLLDSIKTEGGWPNYVARLVYPPIASDVNELTLLIPVLQNMPIGAAAENWEIIFHLKPAPTDITYAPVIEFTPVSQEVTPVVGETSTPALSNISKSNGVTLQLDSVIELEDGYVFTGNLSWSDSVFPTGNGIIAGAVIPVLTDANGQVIPIEEVPLNGALMDDHNMPWSYRTNSKAFSGPLTFSISSIKTSISASPIDFEMDFGSNPQIGQRWEVNRDFVVNGQTVRLLTVSLGSVPDTCQGVGVGFEFTPNPPGIYDYVEDTVPQEPMICSNEHGGGGGGGPAHPNIFYAGASYKDMPSGLRHYSISVSVPYEINGSWQVTWTPPLTSTPMPTPAAGACLTLDKWNQLSARNDPLPSGSGGKILTTVNEGGLWPAVYIGTLDGTVSTKVGTATWPSLSTDGTRLAYSVEDGIHIHNLSSGENYAIGSDGYRIIWSPDNTRLMYTNASNLFIANVDGSGLRKIDTDSAQVISPSGWLPDNQTIVYAVMGGDGFTFTTYNLQSGETNKLFTIQNKAGFGAISPDGQWISFADRIFGANNWGIFISRLDGSERRMVAEPEVPTGFASVWSPDSQWLIITTMKNDGSYIPMLVNPFTCDVARLNINGSIDGWSP
ncbi:hypothetical protein MASR2M66_02650 [Chloroflexota bacterium]